MRSVAIVASAIVLFGSVSADAAKLDGKIVISTEFIQSVEDAERSRSKAQRAYYWNDQNGLLDVLPPLVNPSSDFAVIMSQEGVKPAGPDEVKTLKVLAAGLASRVTVTRPGSTLRFESSGPFEHELFSPELVTFEPQRQAEGAFRAIEFAEKGVYTVRCKLMPHFKGYVVVSDDPWVVKVKRDGAFSVSDIQEGKYTIRVFYEGQWLMNHKFEVPAKQRGDVAISVTLPAMAPQEKAVGAKKVAGASEKPAPASKE